MVLAQTRDAYGGIPAIKGKPTGYFHVQQINGIWWLITPDGNGFLSKGINDVGMGANFSPKLGYSPYKRACEAKYGSADKWAAATVKRMWEWNFNTVGAWSGREVYRQSMPYTLLVDMAARAGSNWQSGQVADVFSPQFAEALNRQAQRVCKPLAEDKTLIGYFTDNELRWAADWRSKKSLFEEFMAFKPESSGKQAAIRMLRTKYPSPDTFNQAWGTNLKSLDELGSLTELPKGNDAAKWAAGEFLRLYARAYFSTCRDAIRAADPNHMVIGCRFAGYAPQEVVETMKDYIDLISFNNYNNTPPADTLRKLHEVTGKPIMLTEYSFKAMDSGLPNTKGAGKPVATQQDRADHFEQYTTALMKLPFMVGYHWFQWTDEPADGRFDGENSNYGVVNKDDEPWTILVDRMKRLNGEIEQIHR